MIKLNICSFYLEISFANSLSRQICIVICSTWDYNIKFKNVNAAVSFYLIKTHMRWCITSLLLEAIFKRYFQTGSYCAHREDTELYVSFYFMWINPEILEERSASFCLVHFHEWPYLCWMWTAGILVFFSSASNSWRRHSGNMTEQHENITVIYS